MLVQKTIYKTILSQFIRPLRHLRYNILCIDVIHNDHNYIIEECLSQDLTFKLKNQDNCFLVVDNTLEGYSFKILNFFKLLHDFLNKFDIPANKIFYLSSNILEEESYTSWKKENNIVDSINVLSFNYWSWAIKTRGPSPISIDQTIKDFKDKKYFISLNRRKRDFRTLIIYKLFYSKFKKDINLSYDKLTKEDFNLIQKYVCEEKIKLLIDSSPKILDRADFENNWADTFNKSLFESSILSLVNETLYESNSNTSLFYSEKTFKPMIYNHPVFIFGQPGINLGLKKIGFETYDSFFDLDFDTIEDTNNRFSKQIVFLESLSDRLDSMSTNQQIDWLISKQHILLNNQAAIKNQLYNKQQSNRFIEIIESQ